MEFNEDAIRYVRARVPEVAICGVNQREDPTSEIAKFDLVTRFICFWFGTQGSDGFWSQTGSRRLWEPSVRPRKNIIRIGTAARTCPRTCYLLQESNHRVDSADVARACLCAKFSRAGGLRGTYLELCGSGE